VHDPVRVKEKRDARTAKWQAQWAKERTEREEAAALKAEMQRRYDCHDALVEALSAVVRHGLVPPSGEYKFAQEKYLGDLCHSALALAGETP
jgi:hypothetical protein